MKTIKVTLFAVSLGLILSMLHSCGKYPDGPNFSILSRKTRIENVWVHTETIYANGNVEQNPDPGATTEFTSDGDFIYKKGGVTLNGYWDLVNEKKDLRISYLVSGNNDPVYGHTDFEIRKLKSNEMWLKNSSGDVIKYNPD